MGAARLMLGGVMTQNTVADSALPSAAVRDLERHLLGELIRPAHDDYDSARKVHNLHIDRRPALVLRAADAADVIRGITFAHEQGLPLAIRSGGHSIAGHGTVENGLVIDLRRMHGLSIDPETRIAWAQPGLTWGAYAEQAHAYGLATSAGDTASVGVGGLTLGGGIGWMVRKYGLAIDNLLSAEVVTANGRLVRATAEEHPDLFWALRGGGGNFGVATAFQFRLQPAGMILGGAVVYPATREVLRGWADYAIDAPDELTTITSVMLAPPAPFIPADQVGKPVAIIGVCYVGDIPTGQQVVQPLRQIGQPIADITGVMPYPAMFALTEDATRPVPMAVRSGYMERVPDDMLDAVIDAAGQLQPSGGLMELRALGGAMARVPADATAFSHRDKRYMTVVVGLSGSREWTEQLWGQVRPYAQGAYMNFLDDEGQQRVHEAYSPATYERLLAIKRQYDPTNLFRVNQNIR
jgi:FAD/FMN-containing dehydrogenase